MLYSLTFNLALIVFIIGAIYRIIRWFTVKIGPEASQFSARTRALTAIQSLFSVLLSRNIFRLIWTCFAQIIFQGHILKKDPWRWLMHFNISVGILLLILFHALDGQITANLFSDYAPTVNPFLFLRNFFGAMVLLGIVIAACRRLFSRRLKKITTPQDVLALVLLAVILFSGFFLEAAQIVSEPIFDEMVDQYADIEDPAALKALQGYWAKYYGVIFADLPDLNKPGLIKAGEEVHSENCSSCHDRPTAAFVSNLISQIIRPIGIWANSTRFDLILWRVHFLCCFAMLAYLPFSKFFHLFTTSISLMVRSLENYGFLQPANRITRRAISLDACMNCGQCSLHCSVGPINRVLQNPNILPAYKLRSLKKYVQKKRINDLDLVDFNEGSFICTECYRCTQLCPAGINLQDLWVACKGDMALRGPAVPYQQVRKDSFEQPDLYGLKDRVSDGPGACSLNFSVTPWSFSACVQCGICTNVCPVVANYQQDSELTDCLDLTPQQIVNMYRLEITDHALGSRMIWDCFMCFKCQEYCPNQIPIAEMIYELRNRGYQVIKGRRKNSAALTVAL